MIAHLSSPFVLLDDASDGGTARLYQSPVRVIEAHAASEVRPALAAIRRGCGEGLHAAGFLSYEAGAAIEPRLAAREGGRTPLVWFALFDRFETIAGDQVAALLPDPRGAWAAAPEPTIDRDTYESRLADVLELI
ncbi:MAG: aminodeoxychorismate synthase component I, partial [Sphingomonas sp.]